MDGDPDGASAVRNGAGDRCFRHQLLLLGSYLVLTKPLSHDILRQRCASVKIGRKNLNNLSLGSLRQHLMTEAPARRACQCVLTCSVTAYIMPPMSGAPPAAAPFSSGISAMMTSVVSRSDAMEPAF